MAAQKKLDFDRSFQRKLVQLIVKEPDFAGSVIEDVAPEMFDSRVDRFIVQVAKNQHEKGGRATKTILINEARKAQRAGTLKAVDVKPLSKVIGTLSDPLPDRGYIIEETVSFLKHQKVLGVIFDAADLMERNDVEGVRSRMQEAVAYDPMPGHGVGSNYFGSAAERVKRRSNLIRNGIPTGTPLDSYMIHEGLPPGQIGSVIAPPGRGKTAVLVHLAKSGVMESPEPIQVLYISLELDEPMIEDRFDAAFSRIPLNELRERAKEVSSTLGKLNQKLGFSLLVKHFPPYTLSVARLRAYLKRLESEAFYPRLIIIDYADLMLASKGYDDRYVEMGLIYGELRALGETVKAALWTASQANRGSLEKEHVGMEDMADSFQKAMVADVLVGFSQTDEEKKKDEARFFVAKNRNGVSGIEIPMYADTATVSFRGR